VVLIRKRRRVHGEHVGGCRVGGDHETLDFEKRAAKAFSRSFHNTPTQKNAAQRYLRQMI